MRPHERLLLIYFSYVFLASLLWAKPLWPLVILISVTVLLWILRRTSPALRDWVPLALVLVAYREMDLFTPAIHTQRFEPGWMAIDRVLLYEWGVRGAIEAVGFVIPALLELSYLLVYTTGAVGLALVYAAGKRDRAPAYLLAYLAAALFAYALFPYFPSEPPRTVYAGIDLPSFDTLLRRINLFLVGGYGIHSSVFPSAHVSCALGAAIGLRFAVPAKPAWSYGLFCYGFVVALASVYGRYHYAVDAVGGLAVSLITWVVTRRVYKNG